MERPFASRHRRTEELDGGRRRRFAGGQVWLVFFASELGGHGEWNSLDVLHPFLQEVCEPLGSH